MLRRLMQEALQQVLEAEITEAVGAVGTRRTGVTIDSKLRSSIIEGLSVFLSVFDLPDIAATFCPRKPPGEAPAGPAAPAADTAAVPRRSTR